MKNVWIIHHTGKQIFTFGPSYYHVVKDEPILQLRLDLKGETLEKFLEIKNRNDIESNSEAIRMIISMAYRIHQVQAELDKSMIDVLRGISVSRTDSDQRD